MRTWLAHYVCPLVGHLHWAPDWIGTLWYKNVCCHAFDGDNDAS